MVDRFFADRSSGRNGTVECVLASDYDALAAELVALKENYKFSVAAHDEATQQVVSLQNKWASRPLSSEDQGRRIVELEAALRNLIHAARTSGGVAGRDEYLCQYCTEAEIALGGSAPETEVFKGMKDAPTWIDDETKGE